MASTTQLAAELDASERRNRSLRERTAKKAEQALNVACVVAGGGAGGYLDAKFPGKQLGGVSMNLILGTGCVLAGLLGYGGKASQPVAHAGAGLLGWEAGKAMHARFSKSGTTSGYHEIGAGEPISVESMLRDLHRVQNR